MGKEAGVVHLKNHCINEAGECIIVIALPSVMEASFSRFDDI